MAARAWLVGCGVGCGFVLLCVIALVSVGGWFAKRSVQGALDAAQSHDSLVEAHGRVENYTPAPDGAIPAERLELFCAIRESQQPSRVELDAKLADFPPDEALQDDVGVGDVLKILGSLSSLIDPIGEHIDARNRALLESGMGLGEYVYIYSTAYYAALGHAPQDGPVMTKPTSDRGERIMSGDDATYGPRRVQRRYRRYLLAILRNQRTALPTNDPSRAALDDEIRRFESRPDRVAWQDGLPPAIASSLGPFRERLEATYHAATNCFELPASEHEH